MIHLCITSSLIIILSPVILKTYKVFKHTISNFHPKTNTYHLVHPYECHNQTTFINKPLLMFRYTVICGLVYLCCRYICLMGFAKIMEYTNANNNNVHLICQFFIIYGYPLYSII